MERTRKDSYQFAICEWRRRNDEPCGPGMPGGIPPHWQFYFTVDDIEAVQKRVLDAGVKIAMPPMDVPGSSRILQATDDQGGHFALMQEPK